MLPTVIQPASLGAEKGVCLMSVARKGVWTALVAVVCAVGLFAGANSAWGAATAYVTNFASNTVTPIEVASNKAGAEIPVGPVGSRPLGIAITPDGKTAYVANVFIGSFSGTVTPIEVASNKAGAEIPLGKEPFGVAITPDGKTAYVTNDGSNTVTPIEVASNKAGAEIPVGRGPRGIAITPDGKTAYVVNLSPPSGTVTPIEVASNKTGAAIKVGSEPQEIAITPDGKTAYVVNSGLASNSVTPIEVASNKAGAEIKVGKNPGGIAITPDGKTAYVTNIVSNSVTPIEVASNKAGAEIPVGKEPFGIAITPDGKTAYVANLGSNTVTPIEVASNKAGAGIPVGPQPAGVAITPPAGRCAANTGTIKLSPGLSATPAVQTVKIKGTLSGCTGQPFTKANYTATLKTAAAVTCSVLKAAPGQAPSGAAKYKWTPKAKPSAGTLGLSLTEVAEASFSVQVTSATYAPRSFSGTVSQSYAGAASCATKKVKSGTFSGLAVVE
jgi:YVTN family beta-propeller protein